MPKSIGNVFGQEWRDLLKFIAVTKGNTDVPTGLEPMNFRPANLPPASLEEQKKVAKLVEQNRKEYIAKQMKKKQEQDKKLAEQKQKEDKLSKVWHNEVLANWDQMKTTARVRELWTEGIPAKVRNEVWYRAIGNKSIVTVDLFNIMAERGRKLADLLRKHQVIENQIIENKGVPSKVNEKITSLKQCQAGGDQQSQSQVDGEEADSEILEELYLQYHKLRKKLLMLIQIDSTNFSVLAREKSIQLIEQDVMRTFNHLQLF